MESPIHPFPSTAEAIVERQPIDTEKEAFLGNNDRKKKTPLNSIGLHAILYLLAAVGFLSITSHIFAFTARVSTHAAPNNASSSPPARDAYRPWTLPPGLTNCECGPSMQEAVARKCIYDSLSAAWLPPHCRDDELVAEFDQAGPGLNGSWPYFLDRNGSILIKKEDIARQGVHGVFWASHDWHAAHCLFSWQKYVRLAKTGSVMEARFATEEHSKHCSRLILYPEITKRDFLIKVAVATNSAVDEG